MASSLTVTDNGGHLFALFIRYQNMRAIFRAALTHLLFQTVWPFFFLSALQSQSPTASSLGLWLRCKPQTNTVGTGQTPR